MQPSRVERLARRADKARPLLGREVVRLPHAPVNDGLHANTGERDNVRLEGGDVWCQSDV